MYVGYGLAGRKVRSAIHTIGFAAITGTGHLRDPGYRVSRLGIVRIDAIDQLLVDLRASMN